MYIFELILVKQKNDFKFLLCACAGGVDIFFRFRAFFLFSSFGKFFSLQRKKIEELRLENAKKRYLFYSDRETISIAISFT